MLVQILKKNVFGVDFDIEFDFLGPIFKTWQKVYEFRLWQIWQKDMYLKNGLSFEFMKYALKHLPNGSFVIFDFDTTNEKFVQFANFGGNIVMYIPVWTTNRFYSRKADLKKILFDSGIKNAAINERRLDKDKFNLEISFGRRYKKAADSAILICKEIYGIIGPCVFDYKTQNLAQRLTDATHP